MREYHYCIQKLKIWNNLLFLTCVLGVECWCVALSLYSVSGLQHVPMWSMVMSGASQATVTMETPASTATPALNNSFTPRFTSPPNATTSSRMATVLEEPSVPLLILTVSVGRTPPFLGLFDSVVQGTFHLAIRNGATKWRCVLMSV